MNHGMAANAFPLCAIALLEVCVGALLLVGVELTIAEVALATVPFAAAVLTATSALDVRDPTTAEPDAIAELTSADADSIAELAATDADSMPCEA